MNDFWNNVLKDKISGKPNNAAWEDLSKVASFRPIIYIGAGGFGCAVLRKLKADIDELIPEQTIKDGFAFIGLDTHPRDRNDILTDVEYTSLSVGVNPNDVARDPAFSPYLGWFRELAGGWNAPPIYAANKVRAVGKFAFLFPPTLNSFYQNLEASYKKIQTLRKNFGTNIFPKIYIVSSLAGGTGSGLLVDLIVIIKEFLSSKGGEKHLIQAIVATPEALEGEASATNYPDFYANTYSALKEMCHFINGNEEFVSYGIAGAGLDRLKVNSKHKPLCIYLLTDTNKGGKVIVNTLPELGSLIESYLLFEIQTPLNTKDGGAKVQDRENPDSDNVGHGDMLRTFSSIGVIRFGLPYEQIADAFCYSIIRRAIIDELSGSFNVEDVAGWIISQKLAEIEIDQLQDELKKDKHGHPIRILLDVEGDLTDHNRAELGKACNTLQTGKFLTIAETIKPIIENNGANHLANAQQNLQTKFEKIIQDNSLGAALSFARLLGDQLKKHKEILTQELDENRKILEKSEQKVKQCIANVSDTATSGIWGRKGRIQCAVTSFGGDLEASLKQQVIVWAEEEAIKIYSGLLTYCEKLINDWKAVEDAFGSRLQNVEDTIRDIITRINSMAEINKRSLGNRFSIINFSDVRPLYHEYFNEAAEATVALRARKDWREKSLIKDTLTKDKDWFPKAMSVIFDEVNDKINNLDIIKVIERFYPEGKKRDELMTTIIALGSPLYPRDENKSENLYETARVVAIHPDNKEKFWEIFARYKPQGEGLSDAYFSSKHEAIIYTVEHGYTAHSLSRMNNYKAHYDRLLKKRQKLTAEKRAFRPIHAWAGADEWDDLMPKPPGEDESHKLFIVGRAFNYLYPDAKNNQSFIYNKGNNYYLLSGKDGRQEKMGISLETAVDNFNDNPEWQQKIRQDIDNKIEAMGKTAIKKRIEKEYLSVLAAEIEGSENGREKERSTILHALKSQLMKFIERDLKERKV